MYDDWSYHQTSTLSLGSRPAPWPYVCFCFLFFMFFLIISYFEVFSFPFCFVPFSLLVLQNSIWYGSLLNFLSGARTYHGYVPGNISSQVIEDGIPQLVIIVPFPCILVLRCTQVLFCFLPSERFWYPVLRPRARLFLENEPMWEHHHYGSIVRNICHRLEFVVSSIFFSRVSKMWASVSSSWAASCSWGHCTYEAKGE